MNVHKTLASLNLAKTPCCDKAYRVDVKDVARFLREIDAKCAANMMATNTRVACSACGRAYLFDDVKTVPTRTTKGVTDGEVDGGG
jgi:hypothetical protein